MSNLQMRISLCLLAAVTVCSVPATGICIYAGEPAEPAQSIKVKPGEVNWHQNFETACNAAAKSGHPVLLFQMMGKLDERFT